MAGYSDTHLKGRIGYNLIGWPLIIMERAKSDKPMTAVLCEVFGFEHESGSVYHKEIILSDDLEVWKTAVRKSGADPEQVYFKGKLLVGATA